MSYPTDTKVCPGYGDTDEHVLPVSEFGKNRARVDGLCVYCKRCAALVQKTWKKAHPEQVRAAKRAYREARK